MGNPRARYTLEFKLEAVRMVKGAVQRLISRCSTPDGRAFNASSVSSPLNRTLVSAGYLPRCANIAGSRMVRCVTTAREAFRSSRLTSRMARRGPAPALTPIRCHNSVGSVC